MMDKAEFESRTKDDKMLQQIIKYLKENYGYEEKSFMGVPVVVLSYMTGNYNTFDDFSLETDEESDDDDNDEYYDPSEALGNFYDSFPKDKIISGGTDC